MPEYGPDHGNPARSTGATSAMRRPPVARAALAPLVASLVTIVVAGLAATGCTSPAPGTSQTPTIGASGLTSLPVSTPQPTPPSKVKCDSPAASQPVPPAGGIALRELCGATIDVPAWQGSPACPSGPRTFTDGAYFIGPSLFLNVGSSALASDTGIAYADVDHDAKVETLLLLSCGGEGWISQVIALRRSATNKISTMGVVVRTTGPIKRLLAVVGDPAGTAIVQMGDYNAGLGDDGSLSLLQWRVYSWTGTAFAQTFGPTSFPVNPRVTDLAISTTPLAFGAAQGGQRTASMSMTVRNLGPSPTPYSVEVNLPAGVSLVPAAGCTVETFTDTIAVTCTAGELAAGATRTHALTFKAPAAFDPSGSPYIFTARVNIADGHGDPGHDNNEATLAVTVA